jgi:heme exporter protein D
MNWGSWSEFWNMGGHGGYVWSAYGVTAALVVLEVLLLRARLGRARRGSSSRRVRPARAPGGQGG